MGAETPRPGPRPGRDSRPSAMALGHGPVCSGIFLYRLYPARPQTSRLERREREMRPSACPKAIKSPSSSRHGCCCNGCCDVRLTHVRSTGSAVDRQTDRHKVSVSTLFKATTDLSILVGIALAAVFALTAPIDVALAQSGHFITSGANAPVCRDVGTQVLCIGKVAGLGGTTFRIEVEASGTAIVECENPGGNIAPGQDTQVDLEGSTGDIPTPRNGQYVFAVRTDEPVVPNFPTCPNPQWTAHVVDVVFEGDATLRLFEDSNLSDQVTVPIQPES
jgi:hypothetical protein